MIMDNFDGLTKMRTFQFLICRNNMDDVCIGQKAYEKDVHSKGECSLH